MPNLCVPESMQELRMAVLGDFLSPDDPRDLGTVLGEAVEVIDFVRGNEWFNNCPDLSGVRRWSFQAIRYLRSRDTPVRTLIAEAEVLAGFIDTGEIDDPIPAAIPFGTPLSPSGSPPVAPQSPSAPPESNSQSDLPSQVSIAGVATPMVAARNDPGNGVVSTPIPDGGA